MSTSHRASEPQGDGMQGLDGGRIAVQLTSGFPEKPEQNIDRLIQKKL